MLLTNTSRRSIPQEIHGFGTVTELLQSLGIKPDPYFKEWNLDEIPGVGRRGIPVTAYAVREKFKLIDLCHPQGDGPGSWCGISGKSFMTDVLAQEILKPSPLDKADLGLPHSVWIPFAVPGILSLAECFLVRVYKRIDGTTEVMLYRADDPSDWLSQGEHVLLLGESE